MENELENGCLYMNYRGYYGSSGFGSGNINAAVMMIANRATQLIIEDLKNNN